MRLEAHLDALARGAIEAALGMPAAALLKPAKDPAHGDDQVNGVMPLAKQLGKAPRELALPVAELLRADPAIAKAEVAGPGFINITRVRG
jgi:arginyl-tRNA synthetase